MLNDTQTRFIGEIQAAAIIAAQGLHLPPAVLIAQAAVETGWGQLSPIIYRQYNNPWAVRQSASGYPSQPVPGNGVFAHYPSLTAAAEDLVKFVSPPRYANALQAAAAGDWKAYLVDIQGDGYAGNSATYAEAVASIAEVIMLDRPDLATVPIEAAATQATEKEPAGDQGAGQEAPETPTGQAQDSKMTFGEALPLLWDGQKLAREIWNEQMWIELQVPDAGSKNTLPYMFIQYPAGHPAYPNGARVPWLGSQTDILANDWIIIK